MSNLRNHFDHTKRFWDEFPELKYVEPFKTLYKDDKASRMKAYSSKVMWALHYAYNPASKLYMLNEDEKQVQLAKDIIKDVNFDWKSEFSLSLIAKYKEVALDPLEFEMNEWYEIMRMRQSSLKKWYIEELEGREDPETGLNVVNFKSVEALDKLLASTAKYFKEYADTKKNLDLSLSKDNGKVVYDSDSDDF